MAGFDNDTVYGVNVDFTGGSPVTPQMVSNGQLLIGATVAPFIRANTLTAGAGISITNGAGTITITNTGGGGGGGGATSLAGNSGSAPNIGGVINVVGGTNLTTTGDGIQTLTITPTGNLLGLAGLAGTGYVVQTGAGTFVNRTFLAGSGISLTNASGVVGATTITASPIVPTTFTEDGATVATPALNNINIFGTSVQGITTSGAGSTVTITATNASAIQKGVASFDVTNFTVTAGNVVSNAITVTAGTGLTTGGSVNLGGSVTLALDIPVTVPHGGTGRITLTNHGVVIGQAASAVNITAAGIDGQVLIAATGADPAFATVAGTQGVTLTTGANSLSIGLVNVPNSALANSSITVTAGAGISVAGSPVSLGGTVTISASGTIVTQFSADVGVATPSGNNINLLGTSAQGVSTSASGATVTFTVANASAVQKGVASFSATDFTVSSGNVTLNATGAGKTITGDTGGPLSPTANNWNIIGGTNMKTAGAGSTLTLNVQAPFAATTLTANSLLLGNGTSNISALGAATNGQLPIGSTGNPPVLSTLTAGTGISILNAAGSITITNTGSTPQANASLDFSDDFLYNNSYTVNGTSDKMGPWEISGTNTAAGVHAQDSHFLGHPGTVIVTTGTSTGRGTLSMANTAITDLNPLVLGAGILTMTWYFNIPILSTGSQEYTLEIGLGDSVGTILQANGCYLRYTQGTNSGNWQFVTASASTRTTSNSSTTVATGWQVGQVVVNAAATSVEYFVGTTLAGLVSLGTIATNIPTTSVSPIVVISKSAGSSERTVVVDLATLTIALTTAR